MYNTAILDLLIMIGANPLLETLTDPFNQVTLDSTKWTQFTGGSATIAYAAGGATVTFPASTTGSTDGDISSNVVYDLTNSYGYQQVLAVPNANGVSGITDAEMRFQTAVNNYVRWVFEGNTLYAQYDVAGSKTTAFSVTYNSSTHKWWRIREGTAIGPSGAGTAGNVYWDTSADGVTWTNQASVATPITVTDLTVLIAGLGTGNESNPGTYKWNNFNTAPATTSSGATLMMMGI